MINVFADIETIEKEQKCPTSKTYQQKNNVNKEYFFVNVSIIFASNFLILYRTQQSYEVVRRPFLFSGSWMYNIFCPMHINPPH